MFSYHRGDPGPVLHTMGQQLLYSYCVLFLEKFNTFIALYPTIFGYIAINVLLYTETNLALLGELPKQIFGKSWEFGSMRG